MMTLHQIQRCNSTEPYFEQLVRSESQSGLVYVVQSIWPDDPAMDYTCTCPAFKYNGACKHQEIAWYDRCLWTNEDPANETQSTDQRETMRCPRCGAETIKDMVDDD
jgi:hypothetical protein